MRRFLATLAVCTAGASGAMATTLTFEDVSEGSLQDSVGHMPNYQGFAFNYTLDWLDVVDSGWNYGAKSGEFALLNDYGDTGVITAANGSDFSFGGLWAKAWATPVESDGSSSLFGFLQGWNNGEVVWNVDTALNGSYQYFGAQAGMIDELHLGFGNYFLADDIELEGGGGGGVGGVAAVPLTGSLPLLLAGLGGIGFVARQSSRRTASKA